MANSAQRRKARRVQRHLTNAALLEQTGDTKPLQPKAATVEKAKNADWPTKSPSLWGRLLKWFGTTVFWAAALLGIVTGYLALFPRITVFSTEPLNPSNPLITPFVVTNEGPFGINNVAFACHVNKIVIAEPQGGAIIGAQFGWNVTSPRMEVGERASGQCYEGVQFVSPMASGDIQIQVEYRPDYWGFRQGKKFRFITWTNNQGHLVWLPKPVSEPDFIQEK
jgi:hypothetical protein